MRLIDTDIIMADLNDHADYADMLIKDIKEYIAEQPTIEAEPVVRCKDCDWWDRIDDGSYGYCHSCKHGFYSANWEISIYRRYKEDFFCADGERRTDAN